MTLSPLATALSVAIAANSVRRVELHQLRLAHSQHDPTGAASAGARDVLAAALAELEGAKVVSLPRGARQYEAHLLPALPLWVQRTSAPKAPRVALPTRIWREELTAAAAIAATPAEFDVLTAVDAFLREGGSNRPVVPHRERSLELFGDEKRLDRLARTRLFTAGGLTLALLRAYAAPLPLTATYPGDPGPQPTLLIVENHATYASALALARERADAGQQVPAIGYGDGGRIASSVVGITQLDPRPVRVMYFGDLDAAGLRIPAGASANAQALALPPVRPALPLYRALLSHGTPQETAGNGVREHEARALCAWLGDSELEEAAVAVLVAGHRLAQEAVGYERLSLLPTWQ